MILSGQDKVYSFIPPHQGGSLDFAFHKKKEFGEKNERRPLVGTVRRLGNTPFPTQRIGSIRHQASCRHLRYIECFLTPITHHRRSYGSTHSTKGALLHPQWKSSVLSYIEDKMLYEIPCSTALQLCVDYSLRDRCIVFIQEVSVSSCITYEIIDKYDKNFNAFPQVRVV